MFRNPGPVRNVENPGSVRNVRASGSVQIVPRGSASQHKTTAAPEMEAAFLLSVQFVGTPGPVRNVSETQAPCKMFATPNPVRNVSSRRPRAFSQRPCEMFRPSRSVRFVPVRPRAKCKTFTNSLPTIRLCHAPCDLSRPCRPGSVRFVPVSRFRAIC